MWAPQWHCFFFEKIINILIMRKEEDWNFDESDSESDDDDYVSDQGYITG